MSRLPSIAYLQRLSRQDADATLWAWERDLTYALEANRTDYGDHRRTYWHKLISQKLQRVRHHRNALGLA